MPTILGKRAIIIGAGIGGLASAGAVAPYFDTVLVLERDELPIQPIPRRGAPQSTQLHVVLAGGMQALCDLFPGFDNDLLCAGSTQIEMSDLSVEFPQVDPLPRRDLPGLHVFGMTRPLLEFTLRNRVLALQNVEIRDRCSVVEINPSLEGAATGVRYERPNGEQQILWADLVIDAAGLNSLTKPFLQAAGFATPDETTIGVDISYASAIFELPPGVTNWKAVVTLPEAPAESTTGMVFRIDNDRWMTLIAKIHSKDAPRDWDEMLAAARSLRTHSLYDIIRHARHPERILRFGFPESIRRHYERLERFPRGLLPIGDAICRFNPVYGQGMTVAAQEALILNQILAGRVGTTDSLSGLAETFFHRAEPKISAAWAMGTGADFAYEQTTGVRPPDLEKGMQMNLAIRRLAVKDAEVHRRLIAAFHLVIPLEQLYEPELMKRAEPYLSAA
ncbi:FAD-dependent oxidoreductase [Arenibaculum pallidiluteum]|uniref:FAD-dependent oxidoreductase n=1 Tax=Arenibaculum pallidiluteum TaxID=2812559 RepID=UPI001A972BDC|nr:FAD-dependent monooxygenase [Arenibaculum pallidiluteum]